MGMQGKGDRGPGRVDHNRSLFVGRIPRGGFREDSMEIRDSREGEVAVSERVRLK